MDGDASENGEPRPSFFSNPSDRLWKLRNHEVPKSQEGIHAEPAGCDGTAGTSGIGSGHATGSGFCKPKRLQGNTHATGHRPEGKAQSCIVIFLRGGSPHQDIGDLKPEAPEGIRSLFRPIRTVVPRIPGTVFTREECCDRRTDRDKLDSRSGNLEHRGCKRKLQYADPLGTRHGSILREQVRRDNKN